MCLIGVGLIRLLLSKYKFISWLIILGRLVIIDRLVRFGVIVDYKCVLCGTENEFFDYLFFSCSFFFEIWKKMLNWLLFQRSVL